METATTVVLRYMLGNTENVFLNLSESADSFFVVAVVVVCFLVLFCVCVEKLDFGSCRAVRVTCSLKQYAVR